LQLTTRKPGFPAGPSVHDLEFTPFDMSIQHSEIAALGNRIFEMSAGMGFGIAALKLVKERLRRRGRQHWRHQLDHSSINLLTQWIMTDFSLFFARRISG
jgi:hypothetical protein